MITPKTHFSGFVQQDHLVACFTLESLLFVLFYLQERKRGSFSVTTHCCSLADALLGRERLPGAALAAQHPWKTMQDVEMILERLIVWKVSPDQKLTPSPSKSVCFFHGAQTSLCYRVSPAILALQLLQCFLLALLCSQSSFATDFSAVFPLLVVCCAAV